MSSPAIILSANFDCINNNDYPYLSAYAAFGYEPRLYPHQVADDHVADEEALAGEAQTVLREAKKSLVQIL